MFLTDAQTLQAVSDTLQQLGVTSLGAYWSNINTQSHVRAYNKIVAALAGRGYTLAQIQAWDQGADFELELTLCYALARPQAGDAFKSYVDRLKIATDELADANVTAAGAFVNPAGTAGQVGVGMQDVSGDIFVWPDPASNNDPPGPGLGEVTRW